MAVLSDSFWEKEAALLHEVVWELVEDTTIAGTAAGVNVLQSLLTVGIDIDYTLLNDAAHAYARQYSFEFVSMITETSKMALQNEFSEWIASGQPLPALMDSLAPMFGVMRADMIATTEVTRIYADSNKLAWKESGVVAGMQWNTAFDDKVCPICEPLHGEKTDLDGEFDGEIEAPPAHPRCRCWLQPVIANEVVNG